MSNFSYFDVSDAAELFLISQGLEEHKIEEQVENLEDIDEELMIRYGIDLETYCKIVHDLLPMTPVITSALGENQYNAFVDNAHQRMVVKRPVS